MAEGEHWAKAMWKRVYMDVLPLLDEAAKDLGHPPAELGIFIGDMQSELVQGIAGDAVPNDQPVFTEFMSPGAWRDFLAQCDPEQLEMAERIRSRGQQLLLVVSADDELAVIGFGELSKEPV